MIGKACQLLRRRDLCLRFFTASVFFLVVVLALPRQRLHFGAFWQRESRLVRSFLLVVEPVDALHTSYDSLTNQPGSAPSSPVRVRWTAGHGTRLFSGPSDVREKRIVNVLLVAAPRPTYFDASTAGGPRMYSRPRLLATGLRMVVVENRCRRPLSTNHTVRLGEGRPRPIPPQTSAMVALFWYVPFFVAKAVVVERIVVVPYEPLGIAISSWYG